MCVFTLTVMIPIGHYIFRSYIYHFQTEYTYTCIHSMYYIPTLQLSMCLFFPLIKLLINDLIDEGYNCNINVLTELGDTWKTDDVSKRSGQRRWRRMSQYDSLVLVAACVGTAHSQRDDLGGRDNRNLDGCRMDEERLGRPCWQMGNLVGLIGWSNEGQSTWAHHPSTLQPSTRKCYSLSLSLFSFSTYQIHRTWNAEPLWLG